MPRSLLSKAELQSEGYIVTHYYTKKTRSLVEMNENVFKWNYVCHLVAVAIFEAFEPVFVILKAEVLAQWRNDTSSRHKN